MNFQLIGTYGLQMTITLLILLGVWSLKVAVSDTDTLTWLKANKQRISVCLGLCWLVAAGMVAVPGIAIVLGGFGFDADKGTAAMALVLAGFIMKRSNAPDIPSVPGSGGLSGLTSILGLLVIVSIGVVSIGCPSTNRTRKAVEASARLAVQVQNLETQTEAAYATGEIDKATALKISHIVKDQLNPAVRAYTDAVEAAKTAGSIDAGAFAKLDTLFNAVEGPFADILTVYGALSPGKAASLKLVIEALRSTIIVIRGAFGEVAVHGGPVWTA
jgi:hypothetical protein